MTAASFEELTTVSSTITFPFESFIINNLGISLTKNPIAQRSEGVCKFYLAGFCAKQQTCQFQHTLSKPSRPEKTIVCKHWLRGLCKKGDVCEFLHEYNMKRMPECWFFLKYGECSNPECLYLHIDPSSRGKECGWYARGFCRHGPECKNKHTRKAGCQSYLTGFCVLGPECTSGHPKFELPVLDNVNPQSQQPHATQRPAERQGEQMQRTPFRPMTDVTCFKCGETGHFANNCSNRRPFGQ